MELGRRRELSKYMWSKIVYSPVEFAIAHSLSDFRQIEMYSYQEYNS
jgi:hypothetical protein